MNSDPRAKIPYERLGHTFDQATDPQALLDHWQSVAEVAASTPIEVKSGEDQFSGVRCIKVTLPHATFSNHYLEETFRQGELDPPEGDRRRLVGLRVQVSPWLRGNKIGERLLRNLIVVAKEHGATDYESAVRSQYALRTLGDVFGTENISFLSSAAGEVPTTFDEGVAQLEAAEKHEHNLEHRKIGVTVHADLTLLDTSQWEHPVDPPPEYP